MQIREAFHILAQFAVRCALPPRRSESPGCAADNKPSCVLQKKKKKKKMDIILI